MAFVRPQDRADLPHGGAEWLLPLQRLRDWAPLALMVLCPPAVLALSHALTRGDGSFAALGRIPARALVPLLLGSPTAWAIVLAFVALQVVLLRFLPGRACAGPTDATGHAARYRANGLVAYLFTLALYLVACYPLGWLAPDALYRHFGELLGALNLASFALCAFLYVKGRRAPSPGDHGSAGSAPFDFFWGIELYPRVLGFDVKQLVATRLGMIGWPLLLLSFAAAQRTRHGISDGMIVAVGLQLVYVTKFFFWESGYLRSLDMAHDRAGFYLCWGCLTWLPGVYTASTAYLVDHPKHLGTPLALAIFAIGTLAVVINFLADRQRQEVRATGGACKVWGEPPELVVARYRTSDGRPRENLLLASGYWGIARHFHYLPELVAAFCWTLPVGFTRALPWFYPAFLTVLLVHRALRDERRCAAKYGADWLRYCRLVPYRIVPGVF
jgi:7-dehydrocholesterol reductase